MYFTCRALRVYTGTQPPAQARNVEPLELRGKLAVERVHGAVMPRLAALVNLKSADG